MKKWIIAAVVLAIVGAGVFAASAASVGFDFKVLDSRRYETKTYAVKDPFRSISVSGDEEKLLFKPAEDSVCKVVCHDAEKKTHSVAVSGDTLTIEVVDRRDFIDHIGIFSGVTEITVYLPARDYAELRVATDTGDVEIPADFTFERVSIRGDTADVSCLASAADAVEIAVTTGDVSLTSVAVGSLSITTTTGSIDAASVDCEGDVFVRVDSGKAKLQDLRCRSFTSQGSTGDLLLERVIAAEAFSIVRGTGDVTFSTCDAASLSVRTDTGDVNGSLRSEKVFLVETDTGKVNVPKSVSGGSCEIRTDTGDVRIEIVP